MPPAAAVDGLEQVRERCLPPWPVPGPTLRLCEPPITHPDGAKGHAGCVCLQLTKAAEKARVRRPVS